MRHRKRGRQLGRNASHRKAMFRNMACSLIRSLVVDEDEPGSPKTPGRIVTTLPKARELRPFVEKLITIAKKARPHQEQARDYETNADRGSESWKSWRKSDEWQKWNQAVAPAVALRRRAFALLRDSEAVGILFDDLVDRFEDRPGGYTRIIKLAKPRLGDAGAQAFIEFVGDESRDRVRTRRAQAPVVADDVATGSASPAGEASTATVQADDASASTNDADAAGADTAEPEPEKSDDSAS